MASQLFSTDWITSNLIMNFEKDNFWMINEQIQNKPPKNMKKKESCEHALGFFFPGTEAKNHQWIL